ncbi:MAG: trypsin-like peptidase domain-containing protein [Candidatus Sumerlaeota bacterium]
MKKTLVFLVALILCASAVVRAADNPAAFASPDFREVVNASKKEVFPSVIFIKCVSESFESGDRQALQTAGSGVIISENGEALTNWHVIEKALEVRCLLQDGRVKKAEILGSDKDLDIALLKLDMDEGEKLENVARLGDSSKLEEGDFVMAMGAPWGLARSVSIGIISCTERYLPEGSEYSSWLQTDASISPGNSGGPLVNTNGEVIGINSRGAIIGGDLGFAIPIEVIRSVLPWLRETGKVDWSWTGLQLQPLKDFNRNIYFEADEGVLVAGVDRKSPADESGFQAGDRIVKIGGEPVTAMTDEDLPRVRRRLGMLERGKSVEMEFVRDEKSMKVMKVMLTPREKGEVEGDLLELKRWDFTAKAINKFEDPDLYFQRSEGVFIYSVKYPGNARNAGLNERDIIVSIDGDPIETLEQLEKAHEKALENIEKKPRLLFTIERNGMIRQVVLNFMRDFAKE